MKNRIRLLSFLLALGSSVLAQAGTITTLSTSHPHLLSSLQEDSIAHDAYAPREPWLAGDDLPQSLTAWSRPHPTPTLVQLAHHTAPYSNAKLPSADKVLAKAAALKVKFSTVPEPKFYSMFLLGFVLIAITVQEEKDEKFIK
ncbi:hypothetical protein HSX11_12390 [Oxalobacteraceae bacterium]|nr:hypothetical protein [Oxalobacteraceae bacterium]